jgi:zinc protease
VPRVLAQLPLSIARVTRLAACVLVASILGGCAASAPVTVRASLPHEDVVLENGLRVVVQREAAWRSAVVDVRYRVGSADDPEGHAGLAHLVEHLMFRGTRDLPKKAFDEELSDLTGGSFNAYTTTDATEYYEEIPSTDVPRALFLEAQRMAFPLHDLTEKDFTTERDVVEAERRLDQGDTWTPALEAAFAAAFPRGHGYHESTIGTAESLHRSTLADARAFVTKHYAPGSATLVVVGNVDVAATLRTIAHDFGAIPARPVPERRASAVPPLAADTTTIVTTPGRRGALVAWPAPGRGAPDLPAYRFAARYLDAVLLKEIVRDARAASDVDVLLLEGERASLFVVTIEDVVRGRIDDALREVREDVALLSAERQLWPIGAYRSAAMIDIVQAVNRPRERAHYIQSSLALFGNGDTAQHDLLATQSVTKEEVAEAFAQLASAHRVTVRLVPKGEAP